MSIGQVFGRGLDGLSVNSRGLAVTSNNIANLNTRGYARQSALISSRQGGGAEISGVNSIVNPFVELQLFSSSNDFGTVDGRRRTMAQVEELYNDASGSGLNQPLSDFFNSFSDLANDPSSVAVRQTVREKALVLTNRFHHMANQLNLLKTNLVSEMQTRIETINSLAENIADLNEAIATNSSSEGTLELKAQRLYALRQLSEEINVSYFESENGSLQVQINGGTSLVNEFASGSLSLTDDGSYGGDTSISITLPNSSSSIDITAQISGGRLGGNLIDRNTTLNNQIASLDTLAYQMATQFNALHSTGYGLDGTTGDNFFAALASANNAASNIDLDASVSSDVRRIAAAEEDPDDSGVGDNRMALQLVELQRSMTMSGNTQTFAGYYQGLVGQVGVQSQSVQREYDSQANLINQLELQRESVSGVNLDEESANLIRFQRAFQASARLLSVADTMLDEMLRI